MPDFVVGLIVGVGIGVILALGTEIIQVIKGVKR